MVTLINGALLRGLATMAALRSRLGREEGQDLLEYALLGGLIAAAITGAAVVGIMSGALSSMATGIAHCIDFDSTTACGPF